MYKLSVERELTI